MKRLIFIAITSATIFCIAAIYSGEAMTAATESPVKVEMRLLDSAFKNLITSLILNNPKGIEAPFHEVHKAKMNTEKAMEKGEIKLPKNGDRLKEFIEMDEKFHKELEGLLAASGKGDMKKVQAAAHRLLDACVQCHNRFRN
ncbi:MAG: cytochrome c [Nitrospirae bacterium]|nr:cytochrome c [Nitrospirota bacterium]